MRRIGQQRKRDGQRARPRRAEGSSHADDPRAQLLMALQSSVGNRATADVARRIGRVAAQGPEPTAGKPDSAVTEDTLGQTNIVSSTRPSFFVKPEETKSGMSGSVQPTTEGVSVIDARYTTEGVHPMDPGIDGTPRQLLVTPDVAALTKRGEQEHSDDFAWEHSLVYGEAARAINVLAAKAAVNGPDISAVSRTWRAALHDEISPKLRVTAEASDPRAQGSVSTPWFGAKSKLHGASLERDTKKWHTMKIRTATAKEKESNPVPVGTVLVVTVAGGEVGQHPSEAHMRAAFEALPDQA